jgi:hypothetical protein
MLDGLVVTTIKLPAAPMRVIARSSERCDGGEPTTTVLAVGPAT